MAKKAEQERIRREKEAEEAKFRQQREEEFDIEIPDDFTGTNWISCILGDYSRLESITVKEIVDIVYEKIHNKY